MERDVRERYAFAGLELDVAAAELRDPHGRTLDLGPKAFSLLTHLVRHRDRVVSRSELLDTVWPDTHVSDASLSTAIRQVRRALGERASDRRVIRTYARRGYRLVVNVNAGTDVRHRTGEDAHDVEAPPGARAPIVDAGTRVEAALRAAHDRVSEGASAEEVRSLYRHAFELADAHGAPGPMAQAALGFSGCLLLRGGSLATTVPSCEEIRLLERARAAQDDDTLLGVLLDGRLGVALSATDRMDEGRQLARRAVDRATALGEPQVLCEALLQHGRTLSGPGDAHARMAIAAEAATLARHASLPSLVESARYEHSVGRLRSGEMDAAELRALATAAGPSPSAEAELRRGCWAIARALACGEVAEAEAELARLGDPTRGHDPIAAERARPMFLSEIRRLRGEGLEGEPPLLFDAERHGRAQWMGFAELFHLVHEGQLGAARARYGELTSSLDRLTRNQFWLTSVGIAIWAAEVFGDARGARALYERLLPHRQENATGADSLLLHGPVTLYLGGAAATFGDVRRARIHFEEARERCRQLGVTVPALLARKHLALLEIRAGQHEEGARRLRGVRWDLRRRGLSALLDDLPRYADLALPAESLRCA